MPGPARSVAESRGRLGLAPISACSRRRAALTSDVMESSGTSQFRSPLAGLGIFLRDFLPEQSLQLLFPLGSFLLLLGGTHFWYELQLPGVSEALRQSPRFPVDPYALQRFTHALTAWAGLADLLARNFAQFAFLASLILWVLNIPKAASRFAAWVFLPACLALVAFPVYMIATARQRNAAVDDLLNSLYLSVPAHNWFPGLSYGFYLTVAGLIVLAVSLALVRRGKVSLPVRFRGSAKAQGPGTEKTSGDGHSVFIFIIATTVLALAVADSIALPQLLRSSPPKVLSGTFSVFEWGTAFGSAVAAAVVAFVCAGEGRTRLLHQTIRAPFAGIGLAVALPLALIFVPRLLFKLLEGFGVVVTPFGWREMLVPQPLPSILIVYAIALLEEFALRGYLQPTLESIFGVKRSIFLTALLWSLLPLSFGLVDWSLMPVLSKVPGASLLVQIAILIVYSVAFGWIYI
ncbi:MAG TPA: CPBP family glutamic-type intramembrane protease [Candidatus Acidoferrum sp.]|nr:CPBP family glutamic-type intramembrane protease [Candidatus Acidoferrum sp.]